ncbi:NUDIX hydrolase domain-like protein [Powellomyces hirtus]|nr:NUDIX hydrolase domain-like protein [Powellomyces hirtus]
MPFTFPSEIDNLRAYTPPPDPYGPERRAAVLVGLVVDPETRDLAVWLTLRASTLRKHAGEVSLPGGRVDGTDLDLIATALREAQEEIGLDPDRVECVTCLAPFLSRFLLLVTPVVGIVPEDFVPSANPDEVAACFKVPLRAFLSKENYTFQDVTLPKVGVIRRHAFDWQDAQGRSYMIFGLTADILINAATTAYQQQPEFAAAAPDQPTYLSMIQRLDARGHFAPKM